MKKAYQYVRISQADQSNWSIEGQKGLNQQYAMRHNIEIVRTFVDDGRSAKDFDRPGWKDLEKELSKNRHKIDYLIIPKYDRLIRNTLQGLQQLEKIERSWNVMVLSAMESYAIDPNDPMFFKMRADLLVNAEFERRVISDRSKFGTWQAKMQGRHIGHAPWGYDNARDDQNKPIIVIDPGKVEVIKEIFQRYVSGDELNVIAKAALEKGFSVKGRSAIKRVLENPVYAGMIKVPSYKGDSEKMVDALHDGMIDRYTWYQAQERLRTTNKHVKVSLSEDLPLRGLITCQQCGNALTGGRSKGNGGYYHYYRCLNCAGEHFSAIQSHSQLSMILELFSFDRRTIDRIHDAIFQIYKDRKSSSKHLVTTLKKDIALLRAKAESLEEKFIRDAITSDTYQKWSNRINRDLHGKENELLKLESLNESILFETKNSLEKMTDLQGIYHSMDVLRKQDFFRYVFPAGSIKFQKGYRTKFVNPLLAHNLHKFNGLEVLDVTEKSGILDQNSRSTRADTIIEPIRFFKRFEKQVG